MFDIGLQELLVLGVIALLVFGPSKLPELGRMVGRAMREFRRASDEFRTTVETNLHLNDSDAATQPTSPAPEVAEAANPLPSELEPTYAEGESRVPAVAMGADLGEPYCAQRGSRLFHRRECAWVARIAEADRVYLKRVSDARDDGFIEGPVCEPWEPA